MLLLTNMFQNTQCSSTPTGLHSLPVTSETEIVKDMSLQCSIDNLEQVHTADVTEILQTKAAKLILKVIGINSDLTRFDQLRSKLKEEAQNKKRKPTVGERDE
jgi:hypothetical protein